MKAELDVASARTALNLTQRQGVESRQQQWLCELERAGLNAGPKTGRDNARGDAPRSAAAAPAAAPRTGDGAAAWAPARNGAPVPASQDGGAAFSAQPMLAAAPAALCAALHAPAGMVALRTAAALNPDARSAETRALPPTPLARAAALAAPRMAAAPAPAGSAPDDSPAADAAPHTAASDDTYGQRQMHVFHGADGVQAWVRDAGLSPAQVLLLGTAIASELGTTGNRLSALTVNGRKVSLATFEPSDQGLRGAAAPQQEPIPRLITLNGAV
jgi:hypothetical protein